MKDNFFKVYVSCHTYNQSDYIIDALNGFCIQETNFPFVCAIFDDFSTDGEQEVIKKYLEKHFDLHNKSFSRVEETEDYTMTFARHKTNINCFFAVYFLKYNHYSLNKTKSQYIEELRSTVNYIALCEGDDYWIEPLKLQKQYDLMESHPDCSLCHHDYMILKDNALIKRTVSIPKRQSLVDIAVNNDVATLTMFYRNLRIQLVPKDFSFKYRIYQHFYNLRLAEFGDIIYIDEPMSVYRINQGGIYSMKSLREQFTMAMGNLENMIDWYTKGNKHPEVVVVLKKRAKQVGKSFIIRSVRHLKFQDTFYMLRWTYKLAK